MTSTTTMTSPAQARDLDAIHQVVELYAETLRDGSVEALRKAFHPRAIMSGYFGGDLLLMDMDGFAGLVESVDPPAKTGEPFRYDVVSVEITDDMATAEIREHSFLGHDFRTCFHLTRMDGRWQITSKLFATLGPAGQTG
jgi:hypothetical protein